MDYSKLSDFEINKLVARLLDDIPIQDSNTAIDCYLSNRKGCGVNWFKVGDEDATHFDPCNNPSDAWPIILDNKISIYCYMDDHDESLYVWEALSFGELNKSKGQFSDDPENPLRAAMIVYLMMNE